VYSRGQTKPCHEGEQEREIDEETREFGQYRHDREDFTREVDLADELRIAHHAESALSRRFLKEGPHGQCSEDEYGVRNRARIEADDAADEREHHHQHEGFQDHPEDAEISLLVAQRHIFPDQHPDEFTGLAKGSEHAGFRKVRVCRSGHERRAGLLHPQPQCDQNIDHYPVIAGMIPQACGHEARTEARRKNACLFEMQ
jgi:hypothetical protein